jgi:2-amino-4-hydroxy-6-hydroxymethyldihydropteridine diphosphokinase
MNTTQATDVAWIAVGSNIGHRGRALQRLRDELQIRGLVIEASSSEILTRAVGLVHQPDYHNQVIRVRSRAPLTPDDWLRLVKDAEMAAGRRTTYRWGPRHADADILYLGLRGEVSVSEPDLAVPHPRIHERPFLLRLLAELGMPPGSEPE